MTSVATASGAAKAIRFTQSLSVRDHAANHYDFAAGLPLVFDGTNYCGLVSVNAGEFHTCFGLEGANTLVVAPGSSKAVRRELPAGSFEIVTL